MSKMKLLKDVASDLRSLADSIETLLEAVEGTDPEAKEDAETKKADQTKPKETQPTLEEVRAKLATLSQSGNQAQVKKLITDFGAKKLSDIPKEKYPELLEKMEAL